LVKKKRKKSD
jgi:hypothetical protein